MGFNSGFKGLIRKPIATRTLVVTTLILKFSFMIQAMNLWSISTQCGIRPMAYELNNCQLSYKACDSWIRLFRNEICSHGKTRYRISKTQTQIYFNSEQPHETTWVLLHKFIRFKNSLVIRVAELQTDSMWNVCGKTTFFNIHCRNMLKIYK